MNIIMCLMSIITDFAGKTIFWLGRIMLILLPVGISYSKNLGKDQKTFLELIEDGQICFIAFSISASSIVNILAMWWKKQKVTVFEMLVFLILFGLSFTSTGSYHLFDNLFNKEKDQDGFNQNRKNCRNLWIKRILGAITSLSFLVDVCWV